MCIHSDLDKCRKSDLDGGHEAVDGVLDSTDIGEGGLSKVALADARNRRNVVEEALAKVDPNRNSDGRMKSTTSTALSIFFSATLAEVSRKRN